MLLKSFNLICTRLSALRHTLNSSKRGWPPHKSFWLQSGHCWILLLCLPYKISHHPDWDP
jgi:hypothetical protein